MSLRSLSSKCLAFVGICMGFIHFANAQSQCFIRTDEGFRLNSQPRTSSTAITKDYFDRIAWSNLGQTTLPDENCTKLVLSGDAKSEALWIHNFDFEIPSNAIISGVEAKFFGSTEGTGNVKDTRIYLTDDEGKMVGRNKANRALKGVPWNQNPSIYNYWTYGSSKDSWEYNWTAEEINSSNFGISIELQNRTQEEVTVLFDQIVITVYYEAAIDFCEEKQYLSVYADREEDVIQYDWTIPSGIKYYPQADLPEVMTLAAEGSQLGEYEICLTKTYTDNHTESCCNAINIRSCKSASIGDFVWFDQNANGLQDAGETGIDNKRVFLYNESMVELAETVTQGGYYQFNNVIPGNYFIKVAVTGMQITQASDKDAENDSDFYEYLGEKMSRLIKVTAGEHVTDVDFGFADENSIEGLTWLDKNANGDFDQDDLVLDNVEVTLLDENGALVQKVFSDADGQYIISGVTPGEYSIKMYKSSQYQVSDVGEENDLNSDYLTESFTMEAMSRLNFNGGFFRFASMEGKVWLDRNFDNSQDLEDDNLADIKIDLFDCNNNFIAETYTDSEGYYTFENLRPGEYVLCVSTERDDIYIAKAIECTSCIYAAENENIEIDDFVFNLDANTIDMQIFKDIDNNGSDDGEDGLSNWHVQLYDCNDLQITEGVTNPDGFLEFAGIPNGQYYYTITFPEAHYVNDAFVSGLDDGLLVSDCMDVEDDISIDIPVLKNASIGDHVWWDKNNNGLQDNAEMGLESIDLELYNASGDLVATTSSDENGHYIFENLEGGTYRIVAPDLEGVFQAAQNDLNDKEFNSDFSDENGILTTGDIELKYFDLVEDIDLGLVPSSIDSIGEGEFEISGNLFRDGNGDFEQLDEEGIESVLISLYNCEGALIDQQFTDTEGDYAFLNLPEGEYFLSWTSIDGFGSAISGNSDFNEMSDEESTACFTIDEDDVNINLAFQPFSSLGDFVWLDMNVNGQQDPGEPGLDGIDIIVLDANENVVDETTTDLDGFYSFSELVPGEYFLELTNAKSLYAPALQALGDDETDSDLRFENDRYISERVVLMDGENMSSLDLGLTFHQSIIGGTVYIDDSKDGMRNGVESGMGDLEVFLYSADDNLLQTTVTDVDGIYRFYNVFPGDHYIRFEQPDGYIFSPADVGSDELFDSEVAWADGRSEIFTVVGSEVIEGFNAGLIRTSACVAGYYWVDLNEDGLLEISDQGITEDEDEIQQNSALTDLPVVDAEVSLYAADGSLLETVFTDDKGQYILCDLPFGEYYLNFSLQSGYVFTTADVGSDERLDSDVVDQSGNTSVFFLNDGDMHYGLNAGIHEDNTSPMPLTSDLVDNSIDQRSSKDMDVKIYPNPVGASQLNLAVDSNSTIEDFSWRIVDLEGRVLLAAMGHWLDKGLNTISIDVSSLANGQYILQTIQKNKTENHRLVILSH